MDEWRCSRVPWTCRYVLLTIPETWVWISISCPASATLGRLRVGSPTSLILVVTGRMVFPDGNVSFYVWYAILLCLLWCPLTSYKMCNWKVGCLLWFPLTSPKGCLLEMGVSFCVIYYRGTGCLQIWQFHSVSILYTRKDYKNIDIVTFLWQFF